MPITDFLRRNAAQFPDEIALVEINPQIQEPKHVTWREYNLIEGAGTQPYRREITWRVFDEKSNRVANLLLSRGVHKGDKVAILLMNCIEWLPIYFGILKTGATVVPLNYRYTSSEIEYCVEKADVNILFFGPEFTGRVEEIEPTLHRSRLLFYVGSACPTFAEDYHEVTANCASSDPMVPLCEDEDAAIYFSSGTTGFPKAILHHHRSLTQAAEMEQRHHGQTHEDAFLCIPPLYHTGAKMHWFGSLISGSRAVLLRGVNPKSIFETVSDERCTIVWLLVPWVQDILAALERGEIDPKRYSLDQWRLMHIGAQPVPESLIKRWRTWFPNQQYDTNYGLSESTGPGCVHLGVENIGHVGAIGVPGYRWEAKIVDDDDRPVERGEVGELCVKGPGVMVCYYKDPEETAKTIVDGWLHTGDMARQDDDGFYWLVDRKKDVVISGGENIYPVQIEDFLTAYPLVKDVAVIGLPDERLGEIAAAIIELKPGAYAGQPQDAQEPVDIIPRFESEAELREDIDRFCMALPRYKRPRKVIFAPVPRNPTGKIEKPLLRRRYGAELLVDRENKA
ncbi:MAG: class I adenylate-forming enzyme family protein [Coriobacteriales bacterium]|jgi:long-chain acyl-CoA synthetase